MSILDIDFSAANDNLVPEGDYSVVIEKVEARPAGPNSTTGAPNLNWTCVITEGDYKNRKLWLTTNVGQNAVWKLKDTLTDLGVYEEGMQFETDDASNIIIRPQLAGKAAIATVKHREYQGKVRA